MASTNNQTTTSKENLKISHKNYFQYFLQLFILTKRNERIGVRQIKVGGGTRAAPHLGMAAKRLSLELLDNLHLKPSAILASL